MTSLKNSFHVPEIAFFLQNLRHLPWNNVQKTLQILESEQLLEQPISTEECLRQSLKLEAMLGFKLSTTDRMISEVLYENDIDDDDTLLGNIFDEVDEEE